MALPYQKLLRRTQMIFILPFPSSGTVNPVTIQKIMCDISNAGVNILSIGSHNYLNIDLTAIVPGLDRSTVQDQQSLNVIKQILAANKIDYISHEVIQILDVPNKPGELCKIFSVLGGLYKAAYMGEQDSLILDVSDTNQAMQILTNFYGLQGNSSGTNSMLPLTAAQVFGNTK